jgi:hypothetical protein
MQEVAVGWEYAYNWETRFACRILIAKAFMKLEARSQKMRCKVNVEIYVTEICSEHEM